MSSPNASATISKKKFTCPPASSSPAPSLFSSVPINLVTETVSTPPIAFEAVDPITALEVKLKKSIDAFDEKLRARLKRTPIHLIK